MKDYIGKKIKQIQLYPHEYYVDNQQSVRLTFVFEDHHAYYIRPSFPAAHLGLEMGAFVRRHSSPFLFYEYSMIGGQHVLAPCHGATLSCSWDIMHQEDIVAHAIAFSQGIPYLYCQSLGDSMIFFVHEVPLGISQAAYPERSATSPALKRRATIASWYALWAIGSSHAQVEDIQTVLSSSASTADPSPPLAEVAIYYRRLPKSALMHIQQPTEDFIEQHSQKEQVVLIRALPTTNELTITVMDRAAYHPPSSSTKVASHKWAAFAQAGIALNNIDGSCYALILPEDDRTLPPTVLYAKDGLLYKQVLQGPFTLF